jgi:hypothetical protein
MSSLGIKPFHFHQLPEQYAYMCPVRALAEWIHVSNITAGYLFRSFASDRVNSEDVAMVCNHMHCPTVS